jgi:hypothetical protein
MRYAPLALAAAGFLLLAHAPAKAQAPFFNGNAGIFDPEISVVNSGVVFDTQAVVSADRKYVTLTGRVSQAQLLSLQEFRFQTGAGVPGGQVGGGGAAGGGGVAGGAAQGNVAAQGRAAGTTGAAGAGIRSTRLQANELAASLHPDAGKPYPVPGKFAPTGKAVLEQEGMTLVGRVQ